MLRRLMRSAILVCLLCACCGAAPAPLLRAPSQAPCGALPRELGRVEDDELDEISGLAESHRNPGVFYAHNDSGDDARLFALDRQGQVLAELSLADVPTFVDAEDIAVGPGPFGEPFIYVGDTGNNFASSGIGIPRRKAVVYRVAEPVLVPATRRRQLTLAGVQSIVFTFPDGARDVEALFVDPVEGRLILISKHQSGRSQVLGASAELLAAGGGELELLGELRFGQPPLPGSPMPTSAAISRDGSAILVRTYSSVFLFRRRSGEPVMAALARTPEVLPSPREQQGEAISFADGDASYFTIAEGTEPPVLCATIEARAQ